MALMALTLRDIRKFEDGEPRIQDLRIGEALILARARDIRSVIENNREELETYGGLRAQPANPGPLGGRPGTEYWL
ncbi:MAG: hypothetical protein J2P55_14120, partial [Rhizobiales bacterium]|nr:hypothetical protein [Hyphomicrobiales bacterium]